MYAKVSITRTAFIETLVVHSLYTYLGMRHFKTPVKLYIIV